MREECFPVCLDRDRGRPGGRMILCVAEVNGWVGGSTVGCPLRFTLDRSRRGWGGFIFKLHNNKQQSLGPECSLSNVGTPSPHDLYIPHGLVSINTHTHGVNV